MNPSEIKKVLHNYIDEADKDQLNFLAEAVQAYALKKEEKQKPFKFDPNSTTPMPLEEFYALIERAEENIRNGEVYTEEEADAIMDSWNADDK